MAYGQNAPSWWPLQYSLITIFLALVNRLTNIPFSSSWCDISWVTTMEMPVVWRGIFKALPTFRLLLHQLNSVQETISSSSFSSLPHSAIPPPVPLSSCNSSCSSCLPPAPPFPPQSLWKCQLYGMEYLKHYLHSACVYCTSWIQFKKQFPQTSPSPHCPPIPPLFLSPPAIHPAPHVSLLLLLFLLFHFHPLLHNCSPSP